MSAPAKECILTIGGTMLLLPVEQATNLFNALYGATVIETAYDAAYHHVGYKMSNGISVELKHAEPNLRAKLVLAE